MTLQEIRQRKAAKIAAMRALINKAETETRQLSADESGQCDTIKAEIVALDGVKMLQGARMAGSAKLHRSVWKSDERQLWDSYAGRPSRPSTPISGTRSEPLSKRWTRHYKPRKVKTARQAIETA